MRRQNIFPNYKKILVPLTAINYIINTAGKNAVFSWLILDEFSL